METLLNSLLWILIFYNILGWTLRYYVNKKDREIIREKLDEQIRVIALEKLDEQNIILAYDAENNKFLGQGTTEEELERIIKQRFPRNIFVMNKRIFTAIEGMDVKYENSKTS